MQEEVLKGYDSMKDQGKLSIIEKIRTSLTLLRISKVRSNNWFFGTISDPELVVRQFLLLNYAGKDLVRDILLSQVHGSKSVITLPKPWLNELKNHGINFSMFRSVLSWKFHTTSIFMKVLKVLIRENSALILKLLHVKKFNADLKAPSHVTFINLDTNNVPGEEDAETSKDIISWYLNWEGRRGDFLEIHHDSPGNPEVTKDGKRIRYQPPTILEVSELQAARSYFLWSFKGFLYLPIALITGQWWMILLMQEAMNFRKTQFSGKEKFAKAYYFNNSNWIYRPMWTYAAEERGCEICLYFYSTNCEMIKVSDQNRHFIYGYQSMNWPKYLVWDEAQRRFIERALNRVELDIIEAGSIWFADNGSVSFDAEEAVSVFDVQPQNDNNYKLLGFSFDYYVPEVCNQFISDINEAMSESGLNVVFKRKREIGDLIHPEYYDHLNCVAKSSSFQLTDPSISAFRIIPKCKATISMPWTSTALIAKELGIPSIYYDPTGKLDPNDQANHGIPLVQSVADLSEWISTIKS